MEDYLYLWIICGVVVIGLLVAGFWALDKYLKAPAPNGKPVVKSIEKVAEPAETIVPEIIVSASTITKVDEKPVTKEARRSVADYHKDRWKNRNYELLSLDDATIYDQDDTEISEEDMKKILAFGELFKKKD